MRWMWIDRIVDFEPRTRLAAIKNVSLAEEHLHDHFPATGAADALPVMPASLIIEGMAQTAGILVGTVNRFTEKVILAKITRVELDADVGPGQTLRYDALLDRIDDAGAATSGTVSRLDHAQGVPAWEEIGRIDLMFSHIDQNMAGIEFPEENFVFSENFRTILRAGGLGDLVPPER
ncbi:MAG: beta-hydroxyacyl-ACP dehydratase [Planctomycetes bacterium]|nr:beta-hydroxyacyl-ACP dehydratase [Planctomycetota bacterium]